MTTLSQIAARDLGLQESPKGSNKGPALQKFFDADDLDEKDGYPWCASAVSYWTQQWIKINAVKLKAPRIAGVIRFPEWAKKNGLVCTTKPSANSIFLLGTASHIGVVESVAKDGSTITTIEGNTNAAGSREGFEVCRKTRDIDTIKLYIRLPATA